MKLHNSVGPNPKVVRMFMAERGIEAERVEVDVRHGENRKEPYLQHNPSGQTPYLKLDDGTDLAEILPICEYLEEYAGPSSLIGTTPEERAQTRMWCRRIDLQIIEPMTNGFRYGDAYEFFKHRIRTIPQAADDLKEVARERLAWLDQQMDGKTYICGDRFSLADILLWGFLDFMAGRGLNYIVANKNIAAWFDRVKTRPSAEA